MLDRILDGIIGNKYQFVLWYVIVDYQNCYVAVQELLKHRRGIPLSVSSVGPGPKPFTMDLILPLLSSFTVNKFFTLIFVNSGSITAVATLTSWSLKLE